MRSTWWRKSRVVTGAWVCSVGMVLAAFAPAAASEAGSDSRGAGHGRAGGQSGTVVLHEGTNIGVAVSPDRGSIVFDLQGDLYRMRAGGGKAIRLNKPSVAAALPDWSPDGDRIAFQSYVDNNFHIMTMRPDGSGTRRLTSGEYDHREPAFSPDGSRIAFSSDRGGSYDIWVLDLSSGELTQWTDTAREEYQPTWSPNGERIAYVVGDTNTIEATDAAGNTQTLVAEPAGEVSSPSWSPNGQKLAYTALVDGHSRLYVSGRQVSDKGEDVFPFPVDWVSPATFVYTADGKIKRRDLTGDANGSVRVVPFTAKISFDRPGYQQKDYRFGRQRAREQAHGILWPVISPDGSRVAFVALNDLWVMTVGGKPHRITHDPYTELHPTWSPNGKRLAYSSDKGGIEQIYIRTMATGEEHRLTGFTSPEFTADNQYRATWCPHGDKIAFQTGSGFTETVTYVADVSTGNVRKAFGILFEPGAPTWGPGCDTLALAAVNVINDRYRQGHNEIRTVDLSTGEKAWVDPAPFRNISTRASGNGPVWSPDGTRMAFVRGSVLWVMPVGEDGRPTGKPRPITDEVADYISWTGDSQQLLYLSNGELRLVSAEGGQPRTVPLDLSWRPQVPAGLTVIRAGKLWDGTSPKVRRDVFILVGGARILAVLPTRGGGHGAETAVPDIAGMPDVANVSGLLKLPGVRYVDASELTVMPGLMDAHVHREWIPFLGAREGRELLSFGITSTVAVGDPAYRSLESEEAILSGALVGPRAFTAGEHINGSRIYYGWMRTTANEEMLRRELSRIRALDMDILKTYVRLPNRFQREAIRAAHEMGIPAFSHYFYPSLAFGQDGMTHLSATQRLGFSRTQSQGGFTYRDVVELAIRSKMAITTTPFSSTLLAEHPDVLSDRRIQALYTDWQQEMLREAYEEATTTPQSGTRERLRRAQNTLAKIAERGGVIMAGTDQPLVHVGFSLQQTLRIMVRFGTWTPYEALRAATIVPAKQIGVADDLGTVEAGKIADLVFVEGNPLENIEAAADVQKVMRGGRLHTVGDLLAPFRDK